jgi:hypothetical protein
LFNNKIHLFVYFLQRKAKIMNVFAFYLHNLYTMNSPPTHGGGWKVNGWVKGAPFTLNPAWGKGLRQLVKGGT